MSSPTRCSAGTRIIRILMSTTWRIERLFGSRKIGMLWWTCTMSLFPHSISTCHWLWISATILSFSRSGISSSSSSFLALTPLQNEGCCTRSWRWTHLRYFGQDLCTIFTSVLAEKLSQCFSVTFRLFQTAKICWWNFWAETHEFPWFPFRFKISSQ